MRRRERRGLAYYVFGYNNAYTDAGSLYAQGGVDINRIDDAISTIVREVRRLAEEPVPPAELEKARNSAKGRFVLQLESPHGTIMFGLRREVLEGKAVEPADVLAGLDAVTVDDVQRVAQDVIGGAGLNLALIGPFDDSERFEKLIEAAVIDREDLNLFSYADDAEAVWSTLTASGLGAAHDEPPTSQP